MNVVLILALVFIVTLAWFWVKKPALKGSPPRTWPPNRVKMLPKRKFVVPF